MRGPRHLALAQSSRLRRAAGASLARQASRNAVRACATFAAAWVAAAGGAVEGGARRFPLASHAARVPNQSRPNPRLIHFHVESLLGVGPADCDCLSLLLAAVPDGVGGEDWAAAEDCCWAWALAGAEPGAACTANVRLGSVTSRGWLVLKSHQLRCSSGMVKCPGWSAIIAMLWARRPGAAAPGAAAGGGGGAGGAGR